MTEILTTRILKRKYSCDFYLYNKWLEIFPKYRKTSRDNGLYNANILWLTDILVHSIEKLEDNQYTSIERDNSVTNPKNTRI